MSEQNVEVVRRIYEAAGARDSAAIYALYHPEVELDASQLMPDSAGTYHGHEGLRRLFGEWHEVWGSIQYDYDELIDAGGEHVIAVVNRHASGRVSGIDVERPFWLVWTIRDGMAARVVWYLTPHEAFAAAGMAPPASPNLELVRSIFSHWERGDFSSAEWAHPQIELVITDGPSPGTSRGVAGMAHGWRDWLSVWKDVRIEVERLVEVDDERIVAFVNGSGSGKASGLELGEIWERGLVLLNIREGKVTQILVTSDRDRLLADLGIEAEEVD